LYGRIQLNELSVMPWAILNLKGKIIMPLNQGGGQGKSKALAFTRGTRGGEVMGWTGIGESGAAVSQNGVYDE